nr:hypothetical protein [Microctonus hyperodae filamentous virus]
MTITVKFQQIYKAVDDNGKIITLPVTLAVNYATRADLTSVIQLELYMLKHLIPYNKISSTLQLTPVQFSEKMKQLLGTVNFEKMDFDVGAQKALDSMMNLLRENRTSLVESIFHMNQIYGKFFDSYETSAAINSFRTKIVQMTTTAAVTKATIDDDVGLLLILQRFLLNYRKPYLLYGLSVVVVSHLFLWLYATEVTCMGGETLCVKQEDIYSNIFLMTIYQILMEKNDNFAQLNISYLTSIPNDENFIKRWHMYLKKIDRNVEYKLNVCNNNKDDDDEGILEENGNKFTKLGTKMIEILTCTDSKFQELCKKIHSSLDINFDNIYYNRFVSHSLLLQYKQKDIVLPLEYSIVIYKIYKKYLNDGKNIPIEIIYKYLWENFQYISSLTVMRYKEVLNLIELFEQNYLLSSAGAACMAKFARVGGGGSR